MNPTKKLLLAVLCICCITILCNAVHGQVVAGISANGRIMIHGDTINVCRGGTIIYESLAQGSSEINWHFNNGVPTTGTGAGPITITYNTNGYDTTFQKVGSGAFSDSMFIIVRVADEKPLAGFNYSPNNICGNEEIQFTNTTINGEPFSYLWDLGDGTTSVEPNPIHRYLDAVGTGTQAFQVKLVATNANTCVDSITQNVTIRSVPEASVTKVDSSVTEGVYMDTASFRVCHDETSFNFSFTNGSSTIATNSSYTISWGDGSPDTTFVSWPANDVITHEFPAGSSTMTVRVTGNSGCIGTRHYIVYVGAFPYGTITPQTNTEICEQDSLIFNLTNTADNSVGTSYIFYINDFSEGQFFQHPAPPTIGQRFLKNSCGYVSDDDSSIFANALGAYLLVQNPCGVNSSFVLPIYVSGKPRPTMYISDTLACVNTELSLINTSGFGNIITPSGGFEATCEDRGMSVWTISPSSGYSLVSGTLGSTNGNTSNPLAWTGGSDSLHILFTSPGTYSVKMYVGNERCGMDSITRTIEAILIPAPHTTFLPRDISVCTKDTTIQFLAETISGGGEGLTYQWFVNNTPAGNSNSLNWHFQAGPGTLPEQFDIRLEVDDGQSCEAGVTSGTVTLNSIPVPNIEVSPALVQQQPNYEFSFRDLNPSIPNMKYTWSMGDRSMQTRNGQQVTYQYGDTGTFKVKLVVADLEAGCTAADSVNVTVLYVPGYIQVPNAICPGCSNQSVRKFLPLAKGLRKYRLTIYTSWGQKIFETTSLDAQGSPNVPWDGTLNGKPLQQDVYSWHIEGIFINGTEWKGMLYPGKNIPVKAGFITVIK